MLGNLGIFSLNASLSARRAWIEMPYRTYAAYLQLVALRKESVDRNLNVLVCAIPYMVALRKESVDRNHAPNGTATKVVSRSPQGERG